MKITKKLLRETGYRNVAVAFKNDLTVNELLREGIVFEINTIDGYDNLRLDLQYVDKIEVVCSNCIIMNRALLNDGREVFVKL